MRLRPLDEQVVVVMGASSGVGRETALELAERGAKVIVSARGERGLDSLVDAIRGMGGDAFAVPADVTLPEDMEEVAAKAVERYGRLDTWVHLAAVSLYATFEDTSADEFEQLIRTNLLGTANAARAALPRLEESGGGAFIAVSSIEGIRALPYQSAYSAAKHGMDGLLEALRVEALQENRKVVISQILPSSIDTPLFEHARTRIGVRPKGFPPLYSPRLVARAIAHAAEHPTRRLIVGGAGRVLATLEGVVPGAVDVFLTLLGRAGQRTREPKRASDPDNLYEPIDFDHRVEGSDARQGREWSLYTAWTLSRWSRPATAALLLGAGLLAANALRRGRATRELPAADEAPRLVRARYVRPGEREPLENA